MAGFTPDTTEARLLEQGFRVIGEGSQAVCFTDGDVAIKIEKKVFATEDSAETHSESMRQEQAFWQQREVGSYVTRTQVTTEEDVRGFRVSRQQSLVTGVSLFEAREQLKEGIDFDPSDLIAFLSGALRIFRLDGVMADIPGRPPIAGWYRPLRTKNVIVDENGKPNFIDAGFIRGTRLQRFLQSRSLRWSTASALLDFLYVGYEELSPELDVIARYEVFRTGFLAEKHRELGIDLSTLRQRASRIGLTLA